MNLKFRNPSAAEVNVRADKISKNQNTELIIYIDARTCQNILNETVGPTRWQREHNSNASFCRVSIWDEDLNQWIAKEDAGDSTGYVYADNKGIASDAFKRACVNWGIGACLYTAPNIWVASDKCAVQVDNNGRCSTEDTLRVSEIAYDDHNAITKLVINNVSRGDMVIFSYDRANEAQIPALTGQNTPPATPETNQKIPQAMVDTILNRCRQDGVDPSIICLVYRVNKLNDLDHKQYDSIMNKKWQMIIDYQATTSNH